jgi:hypothetical protein
MRTNEEEYRIYQELDWVTIIKTSKLKWLDHVKRMEDHREPKRALQIISGDRRRKGKPRERCLDDVEDDFMKTGVKRWRINAMDRTEWRKHMSGGQGSSRAVEP